MRATAAAITLALLVGCGGGGGGSDDDARVQINAPQPRLGISASMQLTATVTNAAGEVLSAPVSWSSTNPGVMTVSSNGVVTALQEGSATIRASAAGGTGTIGLEGEFAFEFQIATPTNAIKPGESLQLRMIIQDSDHNDMGGIVTFSSSNPEVASISADGRVTALQVGSTLIRATMPDRQFERLALKHVFVQQPVRNKIAFIRGPSAVTVGGIYVMNPDGSDQQSTVPSGLTSCSPSNSLNKCPSPWQRPSWHPDGMRLATSSVRILAPESFGPQIFVCSTSHPECDVLDPYPTQIVNHGLVPLFGNYAAWSPQGDRLAFSSRAWNPAEHSFAGPPSALELSWSPDGNRVAFIEFESHPTGVVDTDVWIKNVDDSGPIRVTDNLVNDQNPAWSPDGTQIAFATNRDGNFEIYLYRLGDASLVNLTEHAGDDRWPTWSPDGTRIAFQSNRDGNEEIYSMSVDGSDQVNLTNNPAADTEPAWSRN